MDRKFVGALAVVIAASVALGVALTRDAWLFVALDALVIAYGVRLLAYRCQPNRGRGSNAAPYGDVSRMHGSV